MTLRFFFIQLWIGKPKNMPITYDDLVDAETRVFEKEEALAVKQEQIKRVVPPVIEKLRGPPLNQEPGAVADRLERLLGIS